MKKKDRFVKLGLLNYSNSIYDITFDFDEILEDIDQLRYLNFVGANIAIYRGKVEIQPSPTIIAEIVYDEFVESLSGDYDITLDIWDDVLETIKSGDRLLTFYDLFLKFKQK